MLRSTSLVLAGALLAACAEPPAPTSPEELPRPAPGPIAPGTAAPSSRPSKPAEALLVVGGELVDLASLTPRHVLTTDRVFASAISDGVAYLTVRKDSGRELRAYATADGRLLWSHAVEGCFQPVATASGVFCESDAGALHFSRSGGKRQQLGPDTAVTGLLELDGRVLALTSGRVVKSFDAMSGEVLGSLTLPEQPVAGIARGPLVRAGSLACGAAPNDKTTTVMCFDDGPTLAHVEALSVPQGALRQADEDALVVSSFRAPGACEVLATKTGASLARASVPCAAAVVADGAFEGVLSVTPALELLDAQGARRWLGASQSGSSFETAAVARVGAMLIVARYNPIATGTDLFAVDAATGAPLWTADVESLPIAHSKYSNRVELQVTSRGLLLVGREASQELVELFEPSSGKRLGSVVRRR